MTKQAAHIKKRRNEGLCGVEGCPRRSLVHYRCPEHARIHREKMRARYVPVKREKAA